MPSIIPGCEYDIFISYRQMDNKYDGYREVRLNLHSGWINFDKQ